MPEHRKRKHLSDMNSWGKKRSYIMSKNQDYSIEQADAVLGAIKKKNPKAF